MVELLEDRRLLATIDLASLTPGVGTFFYGAEAGDRSGVSVSSAGDVNRDGYRDLLIGAYRADGPNNGRADAGDSYVVFGGPAYSSMVDIDLNNLGSSGITIFGAKAGDNSGHSVSSVGDVNGDGFDDLLIGAYNADGPSDTRDGAGNSYLIFGRATNPTTIDLASLGSAGVTIFGAEAGDASGFSVGGLGDINGDGYDDFIIGAPKADGINNAKSDSGETYLIFGKATFDATIDLANFGNNGVIFYGADSGDDSGASVRGVGDVNGDGIDDLVMGASRAAAASNLKNLAGEAYLVFGKGSFAATLELSTLMPSDGIQIYGANVGDLAGFAVSGAGDLNGDGFDDLIIGAPFSATSGTSRSLAGESYIVFGRSNFVNPIDLQNLGTAGFKLFGVDSGDQSGSTVGSAGDVNGDGFSDLILGASYADSVGNGRSNAGESYVLFGGASLGTTLDLSNLNSLGITIFGAQADDRSGVAVNSVGDMNGDGFDDLVVGAYLADSLVNGRSDAGESYLLLGGNGFTSSTTHLGNANDNSFEGNSGINIMNGRAGNDTIRGLGGADVLLGGQGNDVLAVSDLTFRKIDGGLGGDTLRLEGSNQILNLLNVPDNRITGIEQIDLTGTGNNTLILNLREVLNISDTSNTLTVRRNADDTVIIGDGWTQLANEISPEISFLTYTQGNARLRIQIAGVSNVSNRQVFYNQSISSLFGNGSGNPTNAIDGTKQPLLPGQIASFTNYTNYIHGLNGLLFDVQNVIGLISAADLQFATWNGMTGEGFVPLSVTPTISIIPNGGANGTSRVKIEFANGEVKNTWLRITVLANSSTGLVSNDVFYFGNAIGDMNAGNIGTPAFIRTNATDTAIVRQNLSTSPNSVGISSIHDVNKDGRVDLADVEAVRQNSRPSIMAPFTAPVSLQLAATDAATDVVMSAMSWQPESTKIFRRQRRTVSSS